MSWFLCIYLVWIHLVFWICRLHLLLNLGSFQPLFPWVLLRLTHFLLSSRDSSNTNVRLFVIIHRSLRILLIIIFSIYFFLLFRLDKFYWSLLQLTDSFLCLFHLAVKPIHCIFISYMFFVLKFLFGSFFYFSLRRLCVCWDYFSIVSSMFCICSLKYFYVGCFKIFFR